MITALSFDADQTLWDFRDVLRRALDATAAEMVRRGDVAADRVDAVTLQTVRDEVVEHYRGRAHNLEAVRERSFAVFLERVDHPAPEAAAAELAEFFLDIRFSSVRLYPEVPDALDRLGRRYRLGLLSNGNTYPDRSGLPGVFDAIVLGPDHGFAKPDVRAFETLARGLGVPLDELVHVGDDWDDVEGANAAGAVSVLINRDGSDPPFRAGAHHEVRDLVELEALLASGAI